MAKPCCRQVLVLLCVLCVGVHGSPTTLTLPTEASVLYTGVVNPGAHAWFNFSLNGITEFVLLRANTSFVSLTLYYNGTAVRNNSISSSFPFVISKPSLIANVSSGANSSSMVGSSATGGSNATATPTDLFQLKVSSQSTQVVNFRLEGYKGFMLEFGKFQAGVLNRWRRRYYGIEVAEADLDVLIAMQPNQGQREVDLDLFVYREGRPFSFFRPNSRNRNHFRNAKEEATIQRSDGYWEPGLYIAEVYAPEETGFEQNSYSIWTKRNHDIDGLLGLSMVGLVGALAVLTMCILAAVAILSRHRSAEHGWGDDDGQPAPPPGVSPSELDQLTVDKFNQSMMPAEDATCSICLMEYGQGDDVRVLRCAHVFHQDCIDRWLKNHRNCPLCQQDVLTAVDAKLAVSKPPSAPDAQPVSAANDRSAGPSHVVEIVPVPGGPSGALEPPAPPAGRMESSPREARRSLPPMEMEQVNMANVAPLPGTPTTE